MASLALIARSCWKALGWAGDSPSCPAFPLGHLVSSCGNRMLGQMTLWSDIARQQSTCSSKDPLDPSAKYGFVPLLRGCLSHTQGVLSSPLFQVFRFLSHPLVNPTVGRTAKQMVIQKIFLPCTKVGRWLCAGRRTMRDTALTSQWPDSAAPAWDQGNVL